MMRTFGKIIKLCSCLCLALCLVSLNAPTAQGLRACGSRLNDILQLVCGNGFGVRVRKSIEPLDYYADSEGVEDTAAGLEDWPFLSGVESNSLTKTRRRRLGVVHECCMNACSMSELMSYCRPTAAR